MENPLHLSSLNHISLLCRSVEKSIKFYTDVLGFFPVRRPGSFNFDGAWLFGYGIGIHLLQSENPENMPAVKAEINPKDNHISFQCESMRTVEKKLGELEMKYVKQKVEEGGIYVDQLFFHDPDGFMIEICNCDNLPVIPLPAAAAGGQDMIMNPSCSRLNLQIIQSQQNQLQKQQIINNYPVNP